MTGLPVVVVVLTTAQSFLCPCPVPWCELILRIECFVQKEAGMCVFLRGRSSRSGYTDIAPTASKLQRDARCKVARVAMMQYSTYSYVIKAI